MKDRDCKHCLNHSKSGCTVWDCKFVPEQGPDNDIISRQAVIDEIEQWVNNGECFFRGDAHSLLYARIKGLPPVIPGRPSVIEDIKAEIKLTLDANWSDGLYQALRIIDKHISREVSE